MRQKCCNTQVVMKRDKGLQKITSFRGGVHSGFTPSSCEALTEPTSPQWDGREYRESKSNKTHESWQRQLNKWRKEQKKTRTTTKNKWCKGGHSPPPKSRPMPSQSLSSVHLGRQNFPSPSFLTPVLLLGMTLYGMDYPFVQVGSSVPAVPPPSLSPSLSQFSGGTQSRKQRPECCASAVQQQLKQRCVINTSVATNQTQQHAGCYKGS